MRPGNEATFGCSSCVRPIVLVTGLVKVVVEVTSGLVEVTVLVE